MSAFRPAAAVRRLPLAATIALAMSAALPPAATAVVGGTSSALSQYTVQIAGRDQCSGVAIARQAVVTAGHCASRHARVVAGGASIAVAGIARQATADDGRRVRVSGDAAILLLAEALPYSVASAPVGAGDGTLYTIAGYGTLDEKQRSFGSLHEAQLVTAGRLVLRDPNRNGTLGASACFGDSGGPVMRGGALVGVITRASRPGSPLACGQFTRWAPVVASGTPVVRSAEASDGRPVAERHHHVRRHHPRRHRLHRHHVRRR